MVWLRKPEKPADGKIIDSDSVTHVTREYVFLELSSASFGFSSSFSLMRSHKHAGMRVSDLTIQSVWKGVRLATSKWMDIISKFELESHLRSLRKPLETDTVCEQNLCRTNYQQSLYQLKVHSE